MTDVLFTHSYVLRFDPKEWRTMMPYPPLGTLYAAAAVRERGYSVALFDAMLAESEQEIVEAIDRHRPAFLVIYDDDFNYLTKMCLTRMREAAFRMASIGRLRGCRVIVHSSDATDHLDDYFDHGADFLLIGEAETTLCELLDHLLGNHDGSAGEIPGVVLRRQDGSIDRGPARPPRTDLDSLPLPARDLVEIERYRELWIRHHGYFSLNIATTRGCPFHCNWCAKPIYGQVYNSHSPERIAREMLQLKEEYDVDHIWFCDDIFGLRPGWLDAFSREVERLGAELPFKCLSRADLILRDDAACRLARAGCRTVWIGAESGSQEVLDAMEKGTTLEQIERATFSLRAAGIRTGFFLQFGYPGEGLWEIGQTIEMVRRLAPDEIGISVSYPLPGTQFHDRVAAEMEQKRNWSESADLAMMYRGAFDTRFYRALARFVHMDHRWRVGMSVLADMARGRLPAGERVRRLTRAPFYLLSRELQRVRMAFLR